jgi:uncharacterized membrane protein
MFPWAGFLLAGAAVGLWLDTAKTPRDERRLNLAFAALGLALAAVGYAASFLPPIYAETNFWTSSPTFFFLWLGILFSFLSFSFAWNTVARGWSPVQEMGIASLFVYWIHVEMVYGIPSVAIQRRLTFEQALLAMAAFRLFLYGLVKLKDRVVGRGRRVLSSGHRTSG